MNQDLITLASSSPRRRELLNQIGVRHRVHPVVIDEKPRKDEPAETLVRRLAETKALCAAEELGDSAIGAILAADTVVVLDGLVLGKPASKADFISMLKRLSGNRHEVMTCVCLVGANGAQSRVSTSRVEFRDITDEECQAYWNTGEPADKAGGYAVQGVGALFVTNISGSYSGIVGLPLYETSLLLRDAGIEPLPHNKEPHA